MDKCVDSEIVFASLKVSISVYRGVSKQRMYKKNLLLSRIYSGRDVI